VRRAARALERRVEEQTREIDALLAVARSAASTLELEPLLNNILDTLKQVVDYSGASVGVVDGDEFCFLESRGASYAEREPEMIGVRLPVHDRSGIWEALFRHEPVIIADVRDDSAAAEAFRRTVGVYYDSPAMRYVRSFLDIPLVHRDRLVGLLIMTNREPGAFTERHAGLALAIATHIAAALENARLYAEAQGKAALEERQRLARELHDSVSQALFGIALGASTARRRLDTDPARVGESLDYVLSLADAALTEMRALIFELRPEALERDGLVVALTRHAAATQARHEIAVEAALCEEPDVPLATKEALYRVAQEAMHNTVKHARATRISLALAHGPDGLTLEVRDDGIGFESTDSFPGHLGLVSIRERVERLGGTVELESAPGLGTTIRAVISVDAAPRL
jgi:signal transduction histidine kinase